MSTALKIPLVGLKGNERVIPNDEEKSADVVVNQTTEKTKLISENNLKMIPWYFIAIPYGFVITGVFIMTAIVPIVIVDKKKDDKSLLSLELILGALGTGTAMMALPTQIWLNRRYKDTIQHNKAILRQFKVLRMEK